MAIDDFGVGYSSLQRLVRLPIQTLKIDRSIVAALATNRRAAVIVESAVDLAHSLDLKLTTAEGIETMEVLEKLRGLGVDSARDT